MKKRPQKGQKKQSSSHLCKGNEKCECLFAVHRKQFLCAAGLCSLCEFAAHKNAGTCVGSAKLFLTLVAPTLGFLPFSEFHSSAILIFFSKDLTAFVFFTKAQTDSLAGFINSYSKDGKSRVSCKSTMLT